jgi:hypothetical protein
MFESVSGPDMMNLYAQMHHESGLNPEMDQFIQSHEWGIKLIPAQDIPDYDDPIYYNDPFHRIIDFDEDRIRWWRARMRNGVHVPPIILGPDGSIIDGNHRAQAAKSMGQGIMAYVPMKQAEFVIESDLNYIRKLAGF